MCSPFGTCGSSRSAARDRSAVAGTSRSLLATRRMCVSTGNASFPKENRRRTFAVLIPTPGREVRYARASGSDRSRRKSRVYPPRSCLRRESAVRIDPAFAFASPPTRIASSTCSGFARASRGISGKRLVRERNARSRFASVVFWERIVRIRFLTGSSSWAHRKGRPNLAQRRRETSASLAPISLPRAEVTRLRRRYVWRDGDPPASGERRAATPSTRSGPWRAAP
jgi:hypothetical protein